MKTIKEQLISALEARGCTIITGAPSRKYVTMTRPNRPGTFYYVGRFGALRYGENIANSLSASDQFKKAIGVVFPGKTPSPPLEAETTVQGGK